MEVTLRLNGNEMLHAIRAGALESFIDTVNATEKAVSDITMSTEPKAKKAEKTTEKVEKVTKIEEKVAEIEEKAVIVEETEKTANELEVTLEELRAKFGSLIKAGKKAEVQSILESFEVSKLTDLPKSEYANALAQANAL
jgi:succinate dehydrogenase/fumarate reductase flavoprotein subunit